MRVIRLLHIEDDRIEHHVVSRLLGTIPDLSFEITTSDCEDDAVARFAANPFDIVLLDYHLEQGDGLSCLRRVRRIDPLVPVIAISGVAAPETVAELLEAGAADYIDKSSLTRHRLIDAIRNALLCTDAWRQRAPDRPGARALTETLRALCEEFANAIPTDFFARLDALESQIAELSIAEYQELYQRACSDIGGQRDALARRLRPLQLDIATRLVTSKCDETRAKVSK